MGSRPYPSQVPDRTVRRPLRPQLLERYLAQEEVPWRDVTAVGSTGSTNADALQAVASGAPEGWVLTVDEQVSGRGRLARMWVSPPGAGIAVSVVLRPHTAPQGWGWLPLLAGTAVATALRTCVGVDVGLKWPNDLVVDRGSVAGLGKLGGILVERASGPDSAVVVGMGLNVDQVAEELPGDAATSLRLLVPVVPNREQIIAALLAELHTRYTAWRDTDGDAGACGLRASYERLSATIGRRVRLALPGDSAVEGIATGIDEAGRLLVDDGVAVQAYAAGDVVTTRPAAG